MRNVNGDVEKQFIDGALPNASMHAVHSGKGSHGLVKAVAGVAIDAIQQIPYVSLINRASAGAKGISLVLCTVPPGGGCIPHLHVASETALYLLSGEVTTHYGEKLEHQVTIVAGEALYIAAGVPHCARNNGAVPAVAIAARTDAEEQERVVPVDVEVPA